MQGTLFGFTEEQLAESVEALKGLGVRLVLGRHEVADFSGADLVMVNPAVAPGNKFVNIARESGARLQTEVGLALSLHKGPVLLPKVFPVVADLPAQVL